MGFPCGSAGKESASNADMGLIPGLGRSPGGGERLPSPVFWPGEFHGLYSPRGRKESDTTERLSLSQEPLRHSTQAAPSPTFSLSLADIPAVSSSPLSCLQPVPLCCFSPGLLPEFPSPAPSQYDLSCPFTHFPASLSSLHTAAAGPPYRESNQDLLLPLMAW